MRILRNIVTAFAQYSRIPMPHFEWRDEDVRYSISFFPWVGAVIGALVIFLHAVCIKAGISAAAESALIIAIPLIVTGGFHADGFMDMSDALSSYGDREKKLAILKDPHIGAFAVIRLIITGLIYYAAATVILERSGYNDNRAVTALAAGYFLARALSALSVLRFRSAKNEGMLYYEATSAAAGYRTNLVLTVIWMVSAAALMLWTGGIYGACGIAGALLSFGWYRYISYRELGGITGDTAGYFVTICETAIAAGIAMAAILA